MAAASPGQSAWTPHTDAAALVGDEALLLARVAPTIVARDRVAGAQAAQAAGASVIVMDDGLQNASLVKDFTLAVIDGRRGIGNARVFPAGPLRAPLAAQLARTDALLVIGDGEGARDCRRRSRPAGVSRAPAGRSRGGRRTQGAPRCWPSPASAIRTSFSQPRPRPASRSPSARPFPIITASRAEEAAELIMRAEHDGLALLTTEKDRARMAGEPLLAALAAKVARAAGDA